MKVIVTILLFCMAAIGQTSNDLRQKYGKPKSEIFEIRPDVVMTVSYYENGEIRSMIVEPAPYWLGAHKLDEDRVLTTPTFTELFDELAPKEKRGAQLSVNLHGRWEEVYENVTLSIAGNPKAWRRGVIWFTGNKRKLVAQPNNSFNRTRR